MSDIIFYTIIGIIVLCLIAIGVLMRKQPALDIEWPMGYEAGEVRDDRHHRKLK